MSLRCHGRTKCAIRHASWPSGIRLKRRRAERGSGQPKDFARHEADCAESLGYGGREVSIGTRIEGKVKSLTDFGAFVGLEEGIDGLIHISDMSWTKHIKHPSELFKKGPEGRSRGTPDRQGKRTALAWI